MRLSPSTCSRRHRFAALLGLLLLVGCQQVPPAADEGPHEPWGNFQPLVAMDEGPTYHLLAGYDPVWLQYVKQGVERSRAYWGTYGPTHVWVLGQEDGDEISEEARRAFLEEYCAWRTQDSTRTMEECREHMQDRFFGVLDRGDSEAYLSGVTDTDPHKAELIFINIHKWGFAAEALPDAVLRGIHEYTHVFQLSVGKLPTWVLEGGAVFAEAWLPQLDGRRDSQRVMQQVMRSARSVKDPDLSIADMEEIESAPEEVAEYYRELAYDAGAWAMVFMVSESPTQSVATLRDDFYPLARKIGWEAALCRYVGMQSKAEFYDAFAAFLNLSLQEQLQVLAQLEP